MRRFVRDNGIALFFGVLLLGSLAGQAISGHAEYNNQQVAHGGAEVGLGHYLTSGSFATDVMENWQSEFLQFSLFIFATIWFVQRGSPESKEPGKGGRESEEEQRLGRWAGRGAPAPARRAGGLLRVLYENSLLLVMLLIWLGTWFAQSVSGHSAYNADQLSHHEPTVSWVGYLGSADFWSRTLQNWQSEFLALGSMAVLAIYLRQRGSPESKPVGAPHDATGVEG
jgi:uncharacterized protein DUF6766